MAREEILHRRQPLMALPDFNRGLSAYIESLSSQKRVADMALVTYHRVGEGLFEFRVQLAGNLVHMFQGQLSLGIAVDDVFGGTDIEVGKFLISVEQIREYYSQVEVELSRRISDLNFETFFVIYGGEGEKFQIAVDMVDRLSALARTAGKSPFVHFYVLTCACESLTEKLKRVSLLHAEGRLDAVIYNPVCNAGMGDLDVIANTFLHDSQGEIK